MVEGSEFDFWQEQETFLIFKVSGPDWLRGQSNILFSGTGNFLPGDKTAGA
jgi:hypothetical protein